MKRLGILAALPVIGLTACGRPYKDCVTVEKFGSNRIYAVYDQNGLAVAEYIDQKGDGSVDWFKDYTGDWPRVTKIRSSLERGPYDWPTDKILLKNTSEAESIQEQFKKSALNGKKCGE